MRTIRIYLAVLDRTYNGWSDADKTFLLKVSGEIDRTPVQISINPGEARKTI